MKLRLYRVSYSKPSKAAGYRVNGFHNVATTGVVRAVEITRQEYPDAEIWAVDHRGPIDFVDTDLFKEE